MTHQTPQDPLRGNQLQLLPPRSRTPRRPTSQPPACCTAHLPCVAPSCCGSTWPRAPRGIQLPLVKLEASAQVEARRGGRWEQQSLGGTKEPSRSLLQLQLRRGCPCSPARDQAGSCPPPLR